METERVDNRQRVLIGVGVLVVVVAIILGIVALTKDSGDDKASTTGSSTSSSSTSSSSSSSSSSSTSTTGPTTTTTLPAADLDHALFPDLTSSSRFSEPVPLTEAFALQVLGFDDDLVLGPFVPDGASAGSVTVSPGDNGAISTVDVGKVSDGTWVVMGVHTDSIRLDTPVAGTKISSPQPLLGAAYAFEGHVNVMLYADGSDVPIATTFVLGRGDGVLGDFSGQIKFAVPSSATRGVLVLSAAGGKDGSTVSAIAVRVRF